MDPVSILVAAVAAGAAAGLQDTVTQAVRDAYAGMKRLITRRYPAAGTAVTQLEGKPDSEIKRDSLKEDLTDAGAAGDVELLTAAKELITLVRAQAAAVGPAIGVDLAKVEAAALKIGTVDATGTGVKVVEGKFTGDIAIDNVRAGMGNQPAQDPPPAR